MSETVYDCIIIGCGPAGLGAALYTSRDGYKTLVLEKFYPGGQINNTDRIENYPGSFAFTNALGQNYYKLDGVLDEVRISDVAYNYSAPSPTTFTLTVNVEPNNVGIDTVVPVPNSDLISTILSN